MPAKELELAELTSQSSDPGLWDDPAAAQAILRRADELREEIGAWQELEARARGLAEMAELAAAEPDGGQALASDLERQSLYGILTERYDTPIARVREAFEPVLLRAREARLLDQPRRSLALLVEGLAFTGDGRPVELARTYVRGDRTRYYLERTVKVASRPTRIHPAPPARREEEPAGRPV